MAIKILGGIARNHSLLVPNGNTIRPTSVMLRRRIFDFYQQLDGVVFVDLCAGTGAMAFEAWSRGASTVYVNEINKHVARVLDENIQGLILKHSHKKVGDIKSSQMSAEKFILEFKKSYLGFSESQKEETIIFLDPPYSEKNVYMSVIKSLIDEDWFKGQLWIESDPLKGFSVEQIRQLGLKDDRLYEQGDSFIFITNFPLENKTL